VEALPARICAAAVQLELGGAAWLRLPPFYWRLSGTLCILRPGHWPTVQAVLLALERAIASSHRRRGKRITAVDDQSILDCPLQQTAVNL
jgi:hypothetical protein